MLNLKINTDGNLEITATEKGKEFINENREFDGIFIWCDLLEQYSTNGSYNLVDPENIGALTDAPIIADISPEINDNGEITYYEDTKFFWFPEYETIDEMEKLLNNETVIFTKVQ